MFKEIDHADDHGRVESLNGDPQLLRGILLILGPVEIEFQRRDICSRSNMVYLLTTADVSLLVASCSGPDAIGSAYLVEPPDEHPQILIRQPRCQGFPRGPRRPRPLPEVADSLLHELYLLALWLSLDRVLVVIFFSPSRRFLCLIHVPRIGSGGRGPSGSALSAEIRLSGRLG